MGRESINDFVPSVMNPRAIRKSSFSNYLSQVSTTSRFSLSLKRPGKIPRKALQDISHTQNTSRDKVGNMTTTATALSSDSFLSAVQDIDNAKIPKTECISDAISQTTRKIIEDKGSTIFSSDKSFRTTSEKISSYTFETKPDSNTNTNIPKHSETQLIHSCSTQLYDLEQDMKESSRSKKSIITIDSDDEVVYNINTLDHTISLQQGKCATSEENSKKHCDTPNNLTLVLNKSAVREFSEIVIEPPKVSFIKRKKIVNTVKVQKKITGYLRKIKSPRKCILQNSYTPYSHNDLHQSARCGTYKHSSNFYMDNIELRLQNTMDPKCKLMLSNSDTDQIKQISRPEIPPHKIVKGTKFAVDAFSYGNIPNISTYFLTHFHSDHYMGLRKSFKGVIYCSNITAELCVAKLGVNRNCIKVINVDDTMSIDGVEVTALDANHCPGSLMLVFRLSSGRNILHCGDFRASHTMESYPLFWNMDIHTVYLDTTYCSPRYDFPLQEDSIDMAVAILQRKKSEMKNDNRDFGQVLVVCGTYTIGKEHFFLGLCSRMGCGVWAPPDKAAILKTVLGPAFTTEPRTRAQIHVLDMRLLSYEDLTRHLISMNGAFSEVVAFKPSGWETSRQNRAVVRDNVAIYGIPYSEHSSFSEIIRFVRFLRPELVIPTVPIAGGIKAVQKYFPCPLALKEDRSQKKISDFVTVMKSSHVPAIT